MPYPPDLNETARRLEFDHDFSEHTRLTHLHRRFGVAISNITLPEDNPVVNRATHASIKQAKIIILSRHAFSFLTDHYGYIAATAGGGALRSDTSFTDWALARIRALRTALNG